jgi:allophanate hydrolase
MSDLASLSFDFAALRDAYAGGLNASALAREVIRRVAAGRDAAVWISTFPPETLLAAAADLDRRRAAGEAMPLFGLPFAVKDNIDVAGLPTTAACPAFAYQPDVSATIVQRLLAAGALCIGKTNLDQFATGLVGTRSPYGAVRNAFDADFISGGSSSGSAVAVAGGQVAFALGTDTAGSGRVPAAFNNIVGLKPTRGALSTAGVVPACRSLDCVSVFALTVPDAMTAAAVMTAADPLDGYSRAAPAGYAATASTRAPLRLAVPDESQLTFFGDGGYRQLWRDAVARAAALGIETVTADLGPFLEAAALLYSGPWVAERTAAVGDFIAAHPGAAWPVTQKIIEGGRTPSAIEAFRAAYRLQDLRAAANKLWERADALLVPTAGTIYRLDEEQAQPVALNSNLGTYTNFMNLLDLCGVAVPAGFRPDGLPFGVTVAAPAWRDPVIAGLGERLHRAAGLPLGATGKPLPATAMPPGVPFPDTILAVCGAHMTGLPLNHELQTLGARCLGLARTAPHYRMYRLPGGPVAKPGMIRRSGGVSIEVELWALSLPAFGAFVAKIPAPLGIGTVDLDDGRQVQCFLCEAEALLEAEDVSAHGGWRNYLAALRAAPATAAASRT